MVYMLLIFFTFIMTAHVFISSENVLTIVNLTTIILWELSCNFYDPVAASPQPSQHAP